MGIGEVTRRVAAYERSVKKLRRSFRAGGEERAMASEACDAAKDDAYAATRAWLPMGSLVQGLRFPTRAPKKRKPRKGARAPKKGPRPGSLVRPKRPITGHVVGYRGIRPYRLNATLNVSPAEVMVRSRSGHLFVLDARLSRVVGKENGPAR